MTQLHYFDCYDPEDGIIFVDCLEDLPGIFNNWFDYHDSCYLDFYNQYHKTCTDKLTDFKQATSLQGAFISNTNDVAGVSDLDNASSDISVSETSKTKVDNINCLNVPEKKDNPSIINGLFTVDSKI